MVVLLTTTYAISAYYH